MLLCGNAFTDKVLPLIAIVVSVGLAVSYDYLLLVRGGPNYFSIALIVITFIVVLAMAFIALLPVIRRAGDRLSTR